MSAWSGPYQVFAYPVDEPARPEPVSEPVVVRRRRKGRTAADAAWAQAVRARDGACVVCGNDQGLHAHHITPRHACPELALELGNGETRCVDCHRLAHQICPSASSRLGRCTPHASPPNLGLRCLGLSRRQG